MTDSIKTTKKKFKVQKVIGPVLGVTFLLILMLVQGGFFASGQIAPGVQKEKVIDKSDTLVIKPVSLPNYYQAIGSVISRDEIEIAPRIIARILEVKVRNGDHVKKGQLLATFDAKDLSAIVAKGEEQLNAVRASVSAAKQQISSAKAALDLATTEMKRVRALFEKNAAAKRDYDRAMTAYKQAQAGMQQAIQQKLAALAKLAAAQQGIKQAQAGLSYATIYSPIDGIVAQRLADPGDLGNPGKIILKLFDPRRLQLEVPVRESLVSEIKIGSKISYKVPALDKCFTGEVEEIVPEVDPHSRTFIVKISIKNSKGLMPGMFGTITMPLKTNRKAIIIPSSAIIKTGQLESIVEVENNKNIRHQIRTVPATNGQREVVSGLEANQVIQKDPNS